jgi:hypothetical protein
MFYTGAPRQRRFQFRDFRPLNKLAVGQDAKHALVNPGFVSAILLL